jgi:hypothetical protein
LGGSASTGDVTRAVRAHDGPGQGRNGAGAHAPGEGRVLGVRSDRYWSMASSLRSFMR